MEKLSYSKTTNDTLKSSRVRVSISNSGLSVLFCLLEQSWGVMVSQTDALSQAMKKSSEDLLDGPISKLTLLIRDKQQLRKTFIEQWNLLKQELSKVQLCTNPCRTQVNHRQHVNKHTHTSTHT